MSAGTKVRFSMAMDKISDFKNFHPGKHCFIISSGPSLAELDLEPLRRRLTFGLNRSFIAYPGAYYHCAMDERLFELFPEELKDTRYLFTFPDRPWGIPINLLGANGFSFNLEEGIYSGYTVSYFALQIAVYMGFDRIFFLGLDLKNTSEKTHFFGQDHRNLTHDTTEFPKMIRAFNEASLILKDTDIQVYNCCEDSALKCFPFMSFEDAIKI